MGLWNTYPYDRPVESTVTSTNRADDYGLLLHSEQGPATNGRPLPSAIERDQPTSTKI